MSNLNFTVNGNAVTWTKDGSELLTKHEDGIIRLMDEGAKALYEESNGFWVQLKITGKDIFSNVANAPRMSSLFKARVQETPDVATKITNESGSKGVVIVKEDAGAMIHMAKISPMDSSICKTPIKGGYAQMLTLERTVVKLGNGSDTSGCCVAEAVILKTDHTEFGVNHYLITPKGIALAGQYVDGEKVDYMYSTHCMPLSYAKWIKAHWDIEVTTEMETMVDFLNVFRSGLTGDDEAEIYAVNMYKAYKA